MTGKPKLSSRRIFPRLLAEYEQNLRNGVQRLEIKQATLNTHLNDANRVFEALVFAAEQTDIEKAMRSYGYRAYYGKVIGDLKHIVEQRVTE
jgi:hypothetical protein